MKSKFIISALLAVGAITTATVVTNGEDATVIPAAEQQQTVVQEQPIAAPEDVPAAIQEQAPVSDSQVTETPPTPAPAVAEPAVETPAEPTPEPPTVLFFNVIYEDISSTEQAIYCYTEFSDGTNTKVRIGTRPTPGPGVPRMEVSCPQKR
jgi:hypothetical protein